VTAYLPSYPSAPAAPPGSLQPPAGTASRHGADRAGVLETGGGLPEVRLAYETWGVLNAESSNAVLIEHALTGSSHVARGDSGEDGWWDTLVGPGRTVDTDRYFVVAANMLGGCYGSTVRHPRLPTGGPGARAFPFVTIRDSVRVEARLADLSDPRWHSVLGGSMGGARASNGR
jgi:homoserine O-acetyltransferase